MAWAMRRVWNPCKAHAKWAAENDPPDPAAMRGKLLSARTERTVSSSGSFKAHSKVSGRELSSSEKGLPTINFHRAYGVSSGKLNLLASFTDPFKRCSPTV